MALRCLAQDFAHCSSHMAVFAMPGAQLIKNTRPETQEATLSSKNFMILPLIHSMDQLFAHIQQQLAMSLNGRLRFPFEVKSQEKKESAEQ